MIVHTVLFKIKPGTSKDKVDSMTDSLNGLKKEIPELLELHVGVNFSPRNQSYDIMLYSRFDDLKALQTYSDHPSHRKVIEEKVHPIREDVIVGDLEF